MKSFHLSTWIVILLFLGVMAIVTAVSFTRPSNRCKLDTAQMASLREKARR